MKNRKSITELARDLRKNPTPSEKKLWQILRKKQLNGCKFLRQHPIIYGQTRNKLNFFIADFYCAKKKLVIELDGEIHIYQKDYDSQRDLILQKKNLTVLRIQNEELNSINEVKEKILKYLN